MSTVYLMRSPLASCFRHDKTVGFVSMRGTECVFFDGSLAELAHEVWTRLPTPVERSSLIAELSSVGNKEDAIENVLSGLLRDKLILSDDEARLAQILRRPSLEELG